MQNISVPKGQVDASKNKKPEHSSKKKRSWIDVFVFQTLHDDAKTVTKENRKQGHELVFDKNRVQIIQKVIKWCCMGVDDSLRHIVSKHAREISKQHTE